LTEQIIPKQKCGERKKCKWGAGKLEGSGHGRGGGITGRKKGEWQNRASDADR